MPFRFWPFARKPKPAPAVPPSSAFRVVSREPTGEPHTYLVTTESAEYGRVTQTVVLFPAEFWGSERPTLLSS